MANGLFLQGGGAKGAFQAGAIYAMHEKGLKFNIISGTSIGAVNGYYIYTGNIDKMKESYTAGNGDNSDDMKISNCIPNDYVIDEIKQLDGIDKSIKSFYVNYVSVKNDQLKEKRVNIVGLKKDEALECIKYSSLLPYVCPYGIEHMTYGKVKETYNSQEIADRFKEKLKSGTYNNWNIDGGILNNNFMEPFVQNHVDKLYIIALRNCFKIPQYLLKNYDEQNIVVIHRKTLFKPNDTLESDVAFLKNLFNEGYDTALEIL